MTAQEIIDSLKHARADYHQRRAADEYQDRECLWDSLPNHIAAYLDQVDSKRQVITDQQVFDAIAEALLTEIAERLPK